MRNLLSLGVMRAAPALALAAIGCAVLGVAPAARAADAGCENEARRIEQGSAYLPECRAYEQVSPIDKNGGDITGDGRSISAAASGDAVTYMARAGFGETTGSGAVGDVQYVAKRGATGWASRGVTPTPNPAAFQTITDFTVILGFSDTLSRAVVNAYDLASKTDDAPETYDLYLEDTATGALDTVTRTDGVDTVPYAQEFRVDAWSGDMSHLIFSTPADFLTSVSGTSQQKLYEYANGTLSLAGILPDGSIPPGGADAPWKLSDIYLGEDSISRDGRLVFFVSPTDGSAPKQLYMRKDGTSTVWISQSESSTPVAEPHNVYFEGASGDGTKVLFSTTDRLTDADPGGEGSALYLYTDGPDPAGESNLTFIGRGGNQGENEGGIGIVGASSDFGIIYYVENGGADRLYVWDHGTTHLIADSPGELKIGTRSWSGNEAHPARVSEDGLRLAFLSNRQLTAAPLGRNEAGGSYHAMYLYDESTGTLTCVSCLPNGAPTTSAAQFDPRAIDSGAMVGLPFRANFLSSDGRRVFFSTADALVPQDVNGLFDVYEYDTATGRVSMLSSGQGDYGSWFAEASRSGRDVYIVSREGLIPTDQDEQVDLYDVRAGGGFPLPPPPGEACLGEPCQGPPSAVPAALAVPGSATFVGSGNLAPPPKGVAKRRSTLSPAGARKLRALKVCRRKPSKQRKRCESRVRKRYASRISEGGRAR